MGHVTLQNPYKLPLIKIKTMKTLYCKTECSGKECGTISPNAIKEYLADKEKMYDKSQQLTSTQKKNINTYPELQGSHFWI